MVQMDFTLQTSTLTTYNIWPIKIREGFYFLTCGIYLESNPILIINGAASTENYYYFIVRFRFQFVHMLAASRVRVYSPNFFTLLSIYPIYECKRTTDKGITEKTFHFFYQTHGRTGKHMLVKCDIQRIKSRTIYFINLHTLTLTGMNECFRACEVFVLFAISHQNAETPLFIACAFIRVFLHSQYYTFVFKTLNLVQQHVLVVSEYSYLLFFIIIIAES